MSIVNRYLGRIFFANFLLLVGGLSALVVILDFLANADEVIETSGGNPMALLRYAGLRLPEITTELIPFSVLLAALITLSGLLRHNELVSLRSAGFSQFKLLLALIPVGLAVALPHFLIANWAVPGSARALHDWGVGEYGRLGDDEGEMTWLRDGNNLIRVGRVMVEEQTLGDVTIFVRDGRGNLKQRIRAASARYEPPDWVLVEVQILDIEQNQVRRLDRLPWPGKLQPALFAVVATHPRELSFSDVKQFVDDPEFGNRPQYFYRTWLHKKIALPLSSVLMILLAVPLAQRFQRYGNIAPMMVVGVAVGFSFFVFDGWTLTVGEAGLIPPLVAAWGPTLAFAVIAGAMALHFERQ